MDPLVIYDPQREISVLVDTDDMRALGPVSVGPNAEAELTQFLHSLTPALCAVDSYTLATAYKEFWVREFGPLYQEGTAPDTSMVEQAGDTDGDAAALAEREAIAAGGEPPASAPADADLETDASQADTVNAAPPTGAPSSRSTESGAGDAPSNADTAPTPAGTTEPPPTRTEQVACFACQGRGNVPGGTEGQTIRCNLCEGTGRVTQQVPA